MDLLGLKPILRLLEDLDLPQKPAAISGKRGNFIQQMARVRRVLAKDVFVGISIAPDPRNKSKNIIHLDVPSKHNSLPSYSNEVEKRLKMIRGRYKKFEDEPDDPPDVPTSAEKFYMFGVIEQIVTNGTAGNCSINADDAKHRHLEIKKIVDSIYDLSGTFYYMTRSDKNESIADEEVEDEDYFLVDVLQNITDRYVREMNSSIEPRKFWRPYLEELFKDFKDIDFNRDKVLIWNMEYMKDMALVLDSTDETILETAIWWIVVELLVPHSSKKLRDLWENYIAEMIDIEFKEPRSLHCTGIVTDLMGMAVSWLFVDPNFHTTKGTKVTEMLELIRSAFDSLVLKADWMDRATKYATLEKSRRMTYVIGHPEWLFDEKILNEYYEGIDMRDDEYLKNMLTMIRLMSAEELKFLQEINHLNETFWAAEPTEVNAVHTFIVNHITVPEGILQFPFYELGLEALNYGAIGTILGHELTHGFDNSGRFYDQNGDLRQWWSDISINNYKFKIDCFIKHYGSYYIDEVNDYIDGELTLDENIADNGGLKESFYAYKKWTSKHGREPLLPGFTHLTHEQLLFMGFAHLWCEFNTADSLRWKMQDSHCPGYVRLRGVLRNSQEFSDAWKCPLGSGMNPEKKCTLW